MTCSEKGIIFKGDKRRAIILHIPNFAKGQQKYPQQWRIKYTLPKGYILWLYLINMRIFYGGEFLYTSTYIFSCIFF